jgi:hypothetical protein
MVRRRSCAVSNHEAENTLNLVHPSRRGQKAAPQDEVVVVTFPRIMIRTAAISSSPMQP